jgi:predicted nucleic acid-binding protein
MIVVDASAVLDVLLGTAGSEVVAQRLTRNGDMLVAPHLLDVEVVQVLRRHASAQRLAPDRARQALADFVELPLARYPHEPLLPRVWELRHGMTAYDAVYVALAEVLDVPLVTRDARLAAAGGHKAKVELL